MTNTIRQGAVDFSVAHKVQTTWGTQEAITFALEGIGATLLFAGLVSGHSVSAVIGLLVLVASGLLLIAHLGNPKKIIYLLANIRHSWMSRGAALIPLYMALGALTLFAQAVFGFEPDGTPGVALIGIFLLLTIFVLVKSGLVLATFPAIPFWNGGLLPVLFALHGVTSGLAIFFALASDRLTSFEWVLPALLLALLAVQLIYLVTIRDAGQAARVSSDLISERHARVFWGAGIFGGIVVPLGLGLVAATFADTASFFLFAVVAIFRIVGDIALRDVVLKVGVYEKIM